MRNIMIEFTSANKSVTWSNINTLIVGKSQSLFGNTRKQTVSGKRRSFENKDNGLEKYQIWLRNSPKLWKEMETFWHNRDSHEVRPSTKSQWWGTERIRQRINQKFQRVTLKELEKSTGQIGETGFGFTEPYKFPFGVYQKAGWRLIKHGKSFSYLTSMYIPAPSLIIFR